MATVMDDLTQGVDLLKTVVSDVKTDVYGNPVTAPTVAATSSTATSIASVLPFAAIGLLILFMMKKKK
jgi:hypothetical protein